MSKFFLMALIMTIQLVCSAETGSFLEPQMTRLQEELKGWRRSHREFLVENVHPKKLKLIASLDTDELPRVLLAPQTGELQFYIPKTWTENPLPKVYLIFLIANMFNEFISPSNQEDLLATMKRITTPFGPSIFKLSEHQLNSRDGAVLNEPRLTEQLTILSRIKDLDPSTQRRFEQAFPEISVDWRKLQQEVIPQILEIQYSHLMRQNWNKLQRFYQSLGTPRLRQMIANNDREGVANYLIERLPQENLTAFQQSFFREQIEAIRNPIPSLTSTVLRGGNFQIESEVGSAYISGNVRTSSRAEDNISEPYMLDRLMHETSILQTIMRHSKSTSNLFISTTIDPEIAERFSERSGVMSVIQIDRRRLIPSFFDQRMAESEYLVPFIVFPDEIIADSRHNSIKSLLSRYKKRIEKSEKELTQMTFQIFTEKHRAISCHRVI